MGLKEIQQALADHAHPPGVVDGLYGPKTQRALESLIAAKGARGRALPAPEWPITTAMIHQGRARYPVRELVVHCAATRPDWMEDATFAQRFAEIRRWHRANGWRDIGYHWVIDRDGAILAGRPEAEIGAGVEGRNNGVIHACLIGGHGSSETDRFDRQFTRQQDSALRGLILGVSMRTQITTVSGHNQYAAKACPGFHVPTWFKGV